MYVQTSDRLHQIEQLVFYVFVIVTTRFTKENLRKTKSYIFLGPECTLPPHWEGEADINTKTCF